MEFKKAIQAIFIRRQNRVSSSSRLFEVLNGPSTNLHPDTTPNDNVDLDLFVNFRGFLIFGRLLGLVPVSGVFKHSYKDLAANTRSFAWVWSLGCVLLLAFNEAVWIVAASSHEKRNASEIANSLKGPIFAFWGLFMYAYFLVHRNDFLNIFKVWEKCSTSLKYTRHDSNLKWTIVAVSFVMLASVFLENAVLHMEFFPVFDHINGHIAKWGVDKANAPLIQLYYWRAHYQWNQLLGYHPVLSILAFVYHKLCLFGGNYVDILLTLFARALYFKFYTLNKVAEEVLLAPVERLQKYHNHETSELDPEAWNQLAKDHESLCNVLDAMNNFFSPVVFVSFTINIYFFCMQLLNTLNPNFAKDSIVHSIYAPWSVIHIIVRIFMISLSMARVNEYAHQTREVVFRCPVDVYNGHVAKLDKRVNVGPKLGFSGLGCFTVSKPFMLNILNVVFTIEIRVSN